MSEKLPLTPGDAYKAIIDQLVTETSRGISEGLVVQEGIFSKALDARALNACVQSLSIEHRRLLSEMLHRERISAIGGVLATLEWWVLTREVGLTYKGEPMDVHFAEGLLNDYVGRLNNWEWPEKKDRA